MKVAVVGATGVVGSVLLDLLEKRNFPLTDIIPVASEKSVGNKISFKGQKYSIVSLTDAVKMKPDIALFSAGGSTSLEWAPKFAEVGTRVVDNSSAWRMDSTKKLVVSEVNANVLTKEDYIIANPNCSTMQMLVVLAPLHKKYKIKRLVISTYQSVSGTGKNAIDQLNNEREGRDSSKVYPYSIDQNLLPHCDVFEEDGYTKEENKLINETRKILNEDEIVIYDNSDVISSCRCWYNLIYFGHDPKLVHVLDGGLKKWKNENKVIDDKIIPPITSNYKAVENKKLVKNKQEIDKNITLNEFNVIDARSRERVEGKAPEPRIGLTSG